MRGEAALSGELRQSLKHSLAHLGRRLPCEGQRQNMAGVNPFPKQGQIPVHQDRGLARPR